MAQHTESSATHVGGILVYWCGQIIWCGRPIRRPEGTELAAPAGGAGGEAACVARQVEDRVWAPPAALQRPPQQHPRAHPACGAPAAGESVQHILQGIPSCQVHTLYHDPVLTASWWQHWHFSSGFELKGGKHWPTSAGPRVLCCSGLKPAAEWESVLAPQLAGR